MKVTVYGAAGEVTGSCLLVECGDSRVLVDCGMIQGGREATQRNADPFPFDPRTLDAVVVSHAHIDHSGRLPLLVKAGCRAPVYTHRATRDLCRIMLRDAAYLQEKDAELESRKRARRGADPVEPLYTQVDASRAVRRIRGVDYAARRRIAPGVSLTLHDAGHIIGSAIVELALQDGTRTRRVVYSGDLGHAGAPILSDPAVVTHADLVILESTYGDRAHRSWQATRDEIGGVFSAAADAGGNILIPAFAVGRTQELLHIFREHHNAWDLRRWRFFLDSPMAIAATEVYTRHRYLFDRDSTDARPFQLPNLRFTETPDESRALNAVTAGAVIIAGSGMCTGGRIRHHLKHNLWRPESHVLIAGFQARGTLGRQLVDGAAEVRLWGEPVRVAATIHTVGGLSAHADQHALVAWYRNFGNAPPVVLVHGEPVALEGLAAAIGSTATIARPAQVFTLD